VEVFSCGEAILLSRDENGVSIRMPEDIGFGLRAIPMPLMMPAGFWMDRQSSTGASPAIGG
jgi:hypothetical protein